MATAPLPSAQPPGRKQQVLQIDMTPMVDLGFLLISFFIFTASMSQPRITRLVMPKEGPPLDVPASRSLTILLDKNNTFLYEGLWEEARKNQLIVEASYDLKTGFGHLIRQKQYSLAEKKSLIVLIKPLPSASYQNIMAALDEMLINNVGTYAIIDATSAEVGFLQNR